MASYNELNALIDAYINRNGVQAITGQILNGVLKMMVEQLGRGYTIMGVAGPTTDPGTPDAPESYFASQAGTYTKFGGIAVASTELCLLCYTPGAGWDKRELFPGIQSVNASIDEEIPFPSVDVTYTNGVLSFDFHSIIGDKGDPGTPADISDVFAQVDANIGTPSVDVTIDGPSTGREIYFNFHNLKGETGVTSVLATVDNTVGTPQCSVSLVGQQLTLAFTGLKGAQGDTGVSADYPIAIVNNLTTNDPASALSAAMGVQLEGEISQLEAEVDDLDGQINGETEEEKTPQTLTIDKWYNTNNNPIAGSPATLAGTACVMVNVAPGEKYRITGLGGNKYTRLYATADANRNQVRYAELDVNCRITPMDITIDEGEAYLYVNLSQYDSQTDKVEKVVTSYTPGLEDRVEILEGKTFPITDNTGTSSELAASQKLVTDIKGETDSAISEINKEIDGEITEEYVPVSLSLYEDRIVNTNNDPLPSGPNSGEYLGNACAIVSVSPGEKYRIYGLGGNKYILLYAITDSNRQKVRVAELNVDARTNPVYLEIEQGEAYLYLNFTSYDSLTDKLEKQAEIETPGLKDRVSSLETRVDALEGKDVKVYLPNKLYAVIGDTLQMFFQGIVGVVNIADYDIYAVCSKGKTFPRYFSYTPTLEDVGTTTLTVYVKDRDNNTLGQASCDLVTVSAPSSPVSVKSIFTFGDSLTAGGQWPGEAKRRLVGNSTYDSITGEGLSNLAFYGYMSKTINGQSVNYFGVGGWTWANYISKGAGGAFRFNVSGVSSLSIGAVYTNNGYSYTVQEINITGDSGNIRCTTSANTNTPSASGTLTKTSGDGDATITFASYETENANPLWDDANNKMSFIPYVQDCGASTIDAVYVLLSWNGQQAWKEYSVDDETGHIANAKVFARTLHTEYPNAKLFIMGLQMPSDTGGLGYNYGASGGLIDGQGVKQTAFNYNKALQDLCNLDEFSQYCEFVAVAPQFDSHYNMPHSNTKVNIRNSDTEMIGTNGVHPSPSGYNQIADAVFRSIVANFCQ